MNSKLFFYCINEIRPTQVIFGRVYNKILNGFAGWLVLRFFYCIMDL
jgi:hypothetical protein